MSTVTVVGEALVDLVLPPGESEPQAHPGGGPANISLGLARLGHDATLLTSLGDDAYGKLVHEHLSSNGVSVQDVGAPGTPTSTALARLDEAGVARYEFDLRWDVSGLAVAPGSAALHTGSLGITLEPGRDAVFALMKQAWQDGGTLLTFDPNARPSLTPDRDAAAAWVEQVASLAHVIKLSDEDLEFLYPGVEPMELAERWLHRHGTALVVVTMGGKGVFGATRLEAVQVPSIVVDVVDTVGAGDAFMSGLIDALARRDLLGADHVPAIARLDAVTLGSILADAALVAGITCSRAGANPPTAAEVAAHR